MFWEILLIWIQFIYALILVGLYFAATKKFRKKKIAQESPDLLYIYFRYQAKKILHNGKQNYLEDLKQLAR